MQAGTGDVQTFEHLKTDFLKVRGLIARADLEQAAIFLDRDKVGVRPLVIQELEGGLVLLCERPVRRLLPLAPCGNDNVATCRKGARSLKAMVAKVHRLSAP